MDKLDEDTYDGTQDLERRLTGLCDPGLTEFHEHEMSFSLRTGTDPDVTIRL
uniref:RWD domain-containing protein n=1 Tax=Heterorhabditis bacteriophora TaxID=37862 RepID=A0A1I7XFK5_HETBA